MKKLILASIIAAFAAVSIVPAFAADAKPAEKAPARALPLRGKIDSVDKQAKTIKVGEKVFHVVSTTRIIKDNKPATLEDATAGDDVGISYREGEDKKLNLVSLRLGLKPVAPKKDVAK